MAQDSEIAAMVAAAGLPPAYADLVVSHWRPLATRIAGWRAAAGRSILVGFNGVQGSGKTTLCYFLELLLGRDHGLKTATLSLDDLYLGRQARARLAAAVHPLFATRGVPGTHDLALGNTLITALLTGDRPVASPRFDKGRDEPAPGQLLVAAPVDVLLFEGWCVGAEAQAAVALAVPVNALEATEDPSGIWRGHVNDALAGDYKQFYSRIDRLVTLLAPDFEVVQGWRRQQEAPLQAQGLGMDAAAISHFIAHFERLSRAQLLTIAAKADVVIPLRADRSAGAILWQDRPAPD